MDYEEITQTSRIYKYGEGEEFMSREDAEKQVNRELQTIKRELALQQLYKHTKVKLIEEHNGFQIVVKIQVPKLV